MIKVPEITWIFSIKRTQISVDILALQQCLNSEKKSQTQNTECDEGKEDNILAANKQGGRNMLRHGWRAWLILNGIRDFRKDLVCGPWLCSGADEEAKGICRSKKSAERKKDFKLLSQPDWECFNAEGIVIYNSTEEATADMARRGIPVKTSNIPLRSD